MIPFIFLKKINETALKILYLKVKYIECRCSQGTCHPCGMIHIFSFLINYISNVKR